MIERSEHLSDHLHGKGGQEDQDTTMQEITSLKAQGKKTEAIVVALDKITGFSEILDQIGEDAGGMARVIAKDIGDGYKTAEGFFDALTGDFSKAQDKFLEYLEEKLNRDKE